MGRRGDQAEVSDSAQETMGSGIPFLLDSRVNNESNPMILAVPSVGDSYPPPPHPLPPGEG